MWIAGSAHGWSAGDGTFTGKPMPDWGQWLGTQIFSLLIYQYVYFEYGYVLTERNASNVVISSANLGRLSASVFQQQSIRS
jgi:hypothetical protein